MALTLKNLADELKKKLQQGVSSVGNLTQKVASSGIAGPGAQYLSSPQYRQTINQNVIQPIQQGVQAGIKMVPAVNLYNQYKGERPQLSTVGNFVKGVGALTMGPTGYAIGGGLGMLLDKDRQRGMQQGISFSQQITPLSSVFSPVVGSVGSRSGQIISRIAPKSSNVLTKILPKISGGVAEQAAIGGTYGALTGQNPIKTAVEFAPYGAIGAINPQTSNAKGFTMGKQGVEELANIEDRFLNPQKYATSKGKLEAMKSMGLAKLSDKQYHEMIKDYARTEIDRLAVKYLPNHEFDKTLGNTKAIIKKLVDLSEQNKLGNFPVVGITDKKSNVAQQPLSVPSTKGVQESKPTVRIKQELKAEPQLNREVQGQIKSIAKEAENVPSVAGVNTPNIRSSKAIISPKDKYAFNVNLNKLETENKQQLGRIIKNVQPELEKARGVKLSNKEVISEAKKSGILQQITTREQTLKANAEMLNARQKMVDLDNQIANLAKNGKTVDVQKKMTELVDSLRVVSAEAADRGRKLQSLNINAGDESLRVQILKEIGKVESDTQRIVDEASKVNWDNANDVAKFYRQFIKPTTTEVLDEFRYNNMLSNPRTHLRNLYSNMFQTLITRPATIAATGDIKGAGQYYSGVAKNINSAIDDAVKAFKGESMINKPDFEQISTFKLPKFMTIPSRALEAGDKFFTKLITSGEIARGNIEGANKAAEYSLFRQGLRPEGQGNVLNAIDSATEGVYQLGQKIPALRWFVPFVRTPMNFAKQWIEYSPAGLSTLVGSTTRKEQLAKTMLGSMVTAMGASMAFNDRTTWAAPTDPKEKELFYASGKKPFSVKIGNKWVSMMYAGPFAFALALPAATKYYQEDSRTALTDSQMDKLGKSISSMAEFLSGQTFLEGLGNFVSLIKGDADYTLPKNIAYTASQMIPLQGLVRYISTIVDPIYRKPQGMVQQVISNIPFASKTLPAYTQPNGEPSTRENINLITPYDVTTSKPEYDAQQQQRVDQLQTNALINKAKKDIESSKSGTKQIGDQLIYWDSSANAVRQKTVKEKIDNAIKTIKKSTIKKPKKITLKVSSYKAPKITIKKRSSFKVPKIVIKKPKKIKLAKVKVRLA